MRDLEDFMMGGLKRMWIIHGMFSNLKILVWAFWNRNLIKVIRKIVGIEICK